MTIEEMEASIKTLVTAGFIPLQKQVQSLTISVEQLIKEKEELQERFDAMYSDWLTGGKKRTTKPRHVLNKATYTALLVHENDKPSYAAKKLGLAESTVRKYRTLSDQEAAELPDQDPNWSMPEE